MVREDRKAWKAKYFAKIDKMLDEFPRCFLVTVDNVGSKQMQQIRIALRGKGEVLMGKNTMMRKALKAKSQKIPGLEKILPYLVGNIGFIFTKEDLTEVRDLVLSNKKNAPAKAGSIAPLDVFIPAGNTGMGPEKTSFFQALSIQTKITKGTIEILSDIHLIKKDVKVGASEAALLAMLNIQPFYYGLVIKQVYDNGSIFSPDILDISDDDIMKKFYSGVANVAAVSLAIGYPTAVSVPHSIVNGFKNVAAVCLEADISIPQIAKIKEYLADPSKFAVAAAPVAAPAAAAPAAAKKEEVKKEESEPSDDDMGFGLFD
ncbi:large ribosomal subunit protein uL10 [Hydra vulgaris]|uniref:large ribosomal subunit protein uL10 n=1 Tax=Hydra vulgaris TaxID=6087 RepID=UPI00019251AC|nr:60S acidic ribosomal protein P0 [Hydra vulgaris]